VFTECDRHEDGRPSDLTNGFEAIAIRQYLITIMKKLWEEKKEEERSGANRTRVRDGSKEAGRDKQAKLWNRGKDCNHSGWACRVSR